MKKKRGRPKGSVKLAPKKTVLLQIRLEALEKETFVAAAQVSGQSLSVWVRDRLRRTARDELDDVGQVVPFLSVQRALQSR